jgi:hypothetical protein
MYPCFSKVISPGHLKNMNVRLGVMKHNSSKGWAIVFNRNKVVAAA